MIAQRKRISKSLAQLKPLVLLFKSNVKIENPNSYGINCINLVHFESAR